MTNHTNHTNHTNYTNYTQLSSLINDPIVRAAFKRAERDCGKSFAVPNEPKRTLSGGAAQRRDLELV